MRLLASFLDRIKLLGAAKGATLAAEATVTTIDADHNALDVRVQGSVPLPADAATATLQSAGNAFLSTIATRVADVATGTKQTTGNDALASILAKIIAAPATEAKQDAIKAVLDAIEILLGAGLPAALVGGRLSVDGSGVTQPISGSVTATGTAATGASPSGNPVFIAGVDGGGLVRPILTSAAGNVQTSPAKGTSYSSTAAEASKAYNSPQYPARVRMLNGNAAVRYHVHFNATSLPANGAIPVAEQVCAASGTGEMLFPIPTDRYGTGFVAANSTTATTLTIGSADSLFWIDFHPASP